MGRLLSVKAQAPPKESPGAPIHQAPQPNEPMQAQWERDEGPPPINASPDDDSGPLGRHQQGQGANMMRRLRGLDVAGANNRNRNALRRQIFPQGFAIRHKPRLSRAVSRRVRQRLQRRERTNERNVPSLASPHAGQRRTDSYDCTFEIGPDLPKDIIDAFHLAAGTMACIDTGIHEQQIYRVLGIECVDEVAERDFVGDVDRAGYAARPAPAQSAATLSSLRLFRAIRPSVRPAWAYSTARAAPKPELAPVMMMARVLACNSAPFPSSGVQCCAHSAGNARAWPKFNARAWPKFRC